MIKLKIHKLYINVLNLITITITITILKDFISDFVSIH